MVAAPVESDEEILALRKGLKVAELNAKIREANLRGCGSGACAAPGPKKMQTESVARDEASGSEGGKEVGFWC